jgi:hypothetical protein
MRVARPPFILGAQMTKAVVEAEAKITITPASGIGMSRSFANEASFEPSDAFRKSAVADESQSFRLDCMTR